MDRVPNELLEALRNALAGEGEQRLFRSGKLPGLFAGRGGAAGAAAERAVRDGLLEVTRTEVKGKIAMDWVRVTPQGVDFLYEAESPVRTLHALRETLHANGEAMPAWLAVMQATLHELEKRLTAEAAEWRQRLRGLEVRVEETLRRLESTLTTPPPELLEAFPWAPDALRFLDRRRSAGAAAPCPLPDLYEALARDHVDLSIATFHTGLRRLQERRAVRLRAADEPAKLPRPEFALLEAGQVFYFAGL